MNGGTVNGSPDCRVDGISRWKFLLVQKDVQPPACETAVDEACKIPLGVRSPVVNENVVRSSDFVPYSLRPTNQMGGEGIGIRIESKKMSVRSV